MAIYQNPSHPGDVKQFKVFINGKDVSDVVVTADIFQDIYTPAWTAQFYMNDAANLLTTLPIKAGDEIKCKVETNFGGFKGDGEKEFIFIVYRVGDKVALNGAHQQYTIYAANKTFIENQKTRVRRSFQNQSPQAIVSTILREELKAGNLEFHAADENISIVVPNWSPFNACAWICRVAVCNKAADYCLYQIDNDKFAFKSFEQMYSSGTEKVDIIFNQRPAHVFEKGNYKEDFTGNIQQYQWQHFDGAASMSAGAYKSKTVTFDVISKKWAEKVFTYGEDTPEDREGKNFTDVLSAEDTNISFLPKHSNLFSNGKSPLDFTDAWVGSRKSAVQKMDTEKLTIQIAGAVKAWEWLGKNVIVELPAQEDLSGEKLDVARKGKYVIVAICHNIKKSSYSCNLELIKKRIES